MADGALSIKLRCASWQQLATIYRRDLSQGTLFLKAAEPPAIGTAVHIDLTLPSATVIALAGVVARHIQDAQRGSGVELALAPIPSSTAWLIESALASERRRMATPVRGTPIPTLTAAPGSSPQPPAAHAPAVPVVPVLGERADLASAEHELRRALAAEAESLKKLNPFLVLGVGYEATDADVRAAFGELTRRYHPDRFARYESPQLRQLAAEIFLLIRDAYRRLVDPPARAQVLHALGKPAPAPRAVPDPARPAMPTRTPRTTRVPVVQQVPAPGSGPTAVTSGVPAAVVGDPRSGPIRRAPSEGGAHAAPASERRLPSSPPAPPSGDPPDTAALETLIEQGRLDEAVVAYRAMASRYPGDRALRAGALVCEGLIALAARDRLTAAQRFETALEIDPSHERAARELADMRRQATNERKGLLSRLMGKKEP